jgi:hypothetical protein
MKQHAVRATTVLVALSLVGLWIAFARDVFLRSDLMPAPGAIMLSIFYCSLAVRAAAAGARGTGMPVVLTGALSLVPMGFILLLFPGSARLIGLFDVALILLGIQLVRGEWPEEHAEPEESDTEAVERLLH